MDASNSSMDFTVSELMRSPHKEDKTLAETAREIIRKTVSNVKPILRYVSEPVYYHNPYHACVTKGKVRASLIVGFKAKTENDNPHDLFLTDTGHFFRANRCGSHYTKWSPEEDSSGNCPDTWELLPFDKVVEGLRSALKVAEEKREKHLAAIRERSQKLDEIMAILERPTEKKHCGGGTGYYE